MINARLTKVTSLPNRPIGDGPAGPIDEGYSVEGFYMDEPTPGEHFNMFRYERNGVKMPGVMTTSQVRKVLPLGENKKQIETQNSKYLLEIL